MTAAAQLSNTPRRTRSTVTRMCLACGVVGDCDPSRPCEACGSSSFHLIPLAPSAA